MNENDNVTPPTDTPPATPPADGTTPENAPNSGDGNGENGGEQETFDDESEPSKREVKSDVSLDGIDEEEAKVISKVADAKLAPVQEQLHQQFVDNEVSKFLTNNPEAKPYEARIKRWVNHPNRATFIKQGFPVDAVIAEALAPFQQRIGARKVKMADEKAGKTKNAGTTPPPAENGGQPDWNSMSGSDIEKTAELVKSGRYKPAK